MFADLMILARSPSLTVLVGFVNNLIFKLQNQSREKLMRPYTAHYPRGFNPEVISKSSPEAK